MNAEKYWQDNIQKWTDRCYKSPHSPIHKRLTLIANLLNQDARICELGCGMMPLPKFLEDIWKRDLINYLGIDIVSKDLLPKKFNYLNKGVSNLTSSDLSHYDTIVSMGLFDWLSENEIQNALTLSKDKSFFHTFTIKKPGPRFYAYNFYRLLLKLIFKTPMPKSHSLKEMKTICDSSFGKNNYQIINGPYLTKVIISSHV